MGSVPGECEMFKSPLPSFLGETPNLIELKSLRLVVDRFGWGRV